jgi:hypothetical protein
MAAKQAYLKCYIEHRLWIQRPIPSTARGRKRKRVPNRDLPVNSKRSVRKSAVKTTPAARSTSRASMKPSVADSRQAKLQAQAKLRKQVKELAQYQAALNGRGIRASARLRGTDGLKDEWQTIPEEWLAEPGSGRSVRTTRRPTPMNSRRASTPGSEHSSQESELTELSSDVENDPPSDSDSDNSHRRADIGSEEQSDNGGSPDGDEEQVVPVGFVEWETVRGCAHSFRTP